MNQVMRPRGFDLALAGLAEKMGSGHDTPQCVGKEFSQVH